MTIPYQPEVERAHSTLTARLLFPNTRPQDNLLLVNLLWEDLNNEFIDRDQEETIATIGGNPNMDAGFNLVFGGAKSINRGKGYGWKNLSFKGLKVLLSDEKNPHELLLKELEFHREDRCASGYIFWTFQKVTHV